MRFLIGLLLVQGSLLAQNPETLHLTNVNLVFSPKLSLQLHNRLRTQNLGRDFFQLRGGPIAFYSVAPKLTLVGGFYKLDQRQRTPTRDVLFSRYFTGVLSNVVTTERWNLETRFLYERFVNTTSGDYSRMRHRWQLTGRGRGWQPMITGEILRGQNVWNQRAGIGWNKQVSPWLLLGFGYEMRRNSNISRSHILVTNLMFTKRLFRIEPKN